MYTLNVLINLSMISERLDIIHEALKYNEQALTIDLDN